MLTPACCEPRDSARLRGSSANARTDAATTGPISGDRLQRLDRRVEHALHRPEVPRQRRRRLLADMADAERVDQPRQVVRLLRSICSTTLRPTLPSLRGHARAPIAARAAPRPAARAARRVEVVEVGEVVHQALLDQLVDERLAEPFDVHRRRATRSARGSRRSRAGHDVFSQRQTTSSSSRCSALPHAGQVVGITQGSRVGRPQAEDRRDDLRDDVAALLDDDRVALADVLARDVLGVVQRRHRDRRAGDAAPARAPRRASPRRCGRR